MNWAVAAVSLEGTKRMTALYSSTIGRSVFQPILTLETMEIPKTSAMAKGTSFMFWILQKQNETQMRKAFTVALKTDYFS